MPARPLVLVALSLIAASPAAPSQGSWAQIIPYVAVSGPIQNPAGSAAMVWTHTISIPGATSLMASFETAFLETDEDLIVVSGVLDGETHWLNRSGLKRWGLKTATLNGSAVMVSLHLAPGSTGEVRIDRIIAGDPAAAFPDSLCSGDDRVSSSDARVCRLVTPTSATTVGVCTGWMINDRSTILSAGHCAFAGGILGTVAHFNVPASTATGAMVAPPVADQFPIDQSSVLGADTGIGNDWSVFRLHPNALGQTAFSRQGSAFSLATSLPFFIPGNGPTVRVTGFGGDNTPVTLNFTNQTSTGPLSSIFGDTLNHFVDTEGGNSGGPILLESTGAAIGIHTNGGCDVFLGTNSGTSILNVGLQAAITQVSGCLSATLAAGVSQSFTCTDVIFDVTPAAGRWNVVGVSSTSDWDLSIESTSTSSGTGICDFLLANGNLGAIPATVGNIFRAGGTATGRGQFSPAEALSLGIPNVSSWSSTRILRLFEFQVTSSASYDITINGDPSLDWRLYGPGTTAAWRSRNSSTLIASGEVGGATMNNVALTPGWHCVVVCRDGNAAAPTPTSLALTICQSGAALALSSGFPAAVSSLCQDFSVGTPTANTWAAVGISSTSDWNLMIGPAHSQFTGTNCDFAVANGTLGAISPLAGVFHHAAPGASATADFKNAVNFSAGVPYDTVLAAGHVIKPMQFGVATAGTYDITVSGGEGSTQLIWRLFAPGTSEVWRPRADSIASGFTGASAPVSVALGTGTHLIMAYLNGGASTLAHNFTVYVCTPASTVSLAGSGSALNVSNTCQPFTMTPVADRWNVVGVTSTSDWDLVMGQAESQVGSNSCDFLLGNGHLGATSPSSGIVSRASGTGTGRIQHGSNTTLFLGVPFTTVFVTAPVVAAFEFHVTTPNMFDVSVGGSSTLDWMLFDPGTDAAWRNRLTSIASGGVGGAGVTALPLQAGWHCLVIYQDGGATGSNLGVSVTVAQTPNPVPVLTSLSPTSASTNNLNFTLTASGSGFASGAAILWNTLPLLTAFVSSTELTAVIPASLVAVAGTRQVAVFNPVPGGGTSAALTFTINNPVPVVTSISPASVVAGSALITLDLSGSSFNSQSSVRWNGIPIGTTYLSPFFLRASVSSSLLGTAGTANVTVFNPAPQGGLSASQAFTINNPVPSLTSLAPSSATAGGAGFTLALNGSAFNAQSIARWNGINLPTTFVSTSQLSATVATGLIATAGTQAVTVFNPAPGGGTSSPRTFTTNNPAPLFLTILPASALAGSGSINLSLSGSGFNFQSQARWNGTPLTTTLVSQISLSAQVPSALLGSAGTAQITVVNPAPGGGTSASRTFTINNPVPVLTSLAPASITAGGPLLTLLVNGSGFNDSSTVHWTGSALPVTWISSTQLSVQIAGALIAAPGFAVVQVVNPAPGGGASPATLVPILPPTITSIVPAAMPVLTAGSPPFQVTVNGTRFLSGITEVYADGVPLAVTNLGPGQLSISILPSVVLQAQRPGGIALTVANGQAAPSVSARLLVDGGTGGSNRGLIRRQPLNPAPGQPYAVFMEGGSQNALFSLFIDLENPSPLVEWPDANANQILAVGPLVGSGTQFLPILDGIGLFSPPLGTAFGADGTFTLPGLVAPNPPFGIDLTVQTIYLDPTAPYGFLLTWARYPDRL